MNVLHRNLYAKLHILLPHEIRERKNIPAFLIAIETITSNGSIRQHYAVTRMRHLLMFVPHDRGLEETLENVYTMRPAESRIRV